ncbi:MAG: SDR family oxidoreductase [Ilumatobacteraceae bacterium]
MISEQRFDGKVVFITGGGAGFGLAFAHAFGERGAAVVIADIDPDTLRVASKELEEAGISTLGVACDVADEVSVGRAVAEAVDRFGGVDILFNNAGRHLTRYNRPFAEQPIADIREVFDVNVIGVVNCTLACKDTMAARGGGAIINISSIAGFKSTSPYGVTKLAVRGLTIAFATELSAIGVRVNAIAPGLMLTDNAAADLPEALVAEFRDELQLVHRSGAVDDIVNAALFLCSDAASFITGETLKVAGGHPLQL